MYFGNVWQLFECAQDCKLKGIICYCWGYYLASNHNLFQASKIAHAILLKEKVCHIWESNGEDFGDECLLWQFILVTFADFIGVKDHTHRGIFLNHWR